MTMLERAARAIWNSREPGFPAFTRMTWESGTPEARAATIELARVALMAIREADESTLLASGMLDYEARELARSMWRDMIDAILNEGESR